MGDISNYTPPFNNTVSPDYKQNGSYCVFEDVELVVSSGIFTITLPLLIISIYGLCKQVRSDSGPVFIINLFIADLIVISTNLALPLVAKHDWSYTIYTIFNVMFWTSHPVNVSFMVCISAERYAMVAHPVWYQNIHRVKISVITTVTIWITMTVFVISIFFSDWVYLDPFHLLLLILFLPYPLVLLFFFKTRQVLSKNTALSRTNQRRILQILGLVLCIYTFSFLPTIIAMLAEATHLAKGSSPWQCFNFFATMLLSLNPVFDIVLYVIIRKDAKDLLNTLFRCFYKCQT